MSYSLDSLKGLLWGSITGASKGDKEFIEKNSFASGLGFRDRGLESYSFEPHIKDTGMWAFGIRNGKPQTHQQNSITPKAGRGMILILQAGARNMHLVAARKQEHMAVSQNRYALEIQLLIGGVSLRI